MTEPSTGWQLDDITYSGGTQAGPRATVTLSRAEEQVHAEGSGTGLIDAVCHSISQAAGVAARVVAFRAYSVGPGSDGSKRDSSIDERRGTAPGNRSCATSAPWPPWALAVARPADGAV